MNTSTEFQKLTGRVDARMSDTGNDAFLAALYECAGVQRLIDQANGLLKERKDAISEQLFVLAKDTCDNDVHKFLDRCAQAEVSYKEAKEGRVIPKQWSQAKSNIKAALERDIDLNEYATESAMRKALTAKRKAEREAKANPESVIDSSTGKKIVGDAAIYAQMLANALDGFRDESEAKKATAYAAVRELLDQLDVIKAAPIAREVQDVTVIEGEAVRVAH